MNVITRIVATAAAVGFIATAGCAGLSEASAYRFEIVGRPITSNTGGALTVRMLNASNGERVTNAEIFAVRPVFAGSSKAVPQVHWVRIRLKPDGNGDYLYERAGLRAGGTVRLTARVPGEDTRIVGTVDTRGGISGSR